MGDFLERITGRNIASEGKKKPVPPALVEAMKNFRDAVLHMLGRNLSGQDPDLMARARMMPWLFPDVPELKGNGNVIHTTPVAHPSIVSHRTPDRSLTV
ncbi:MAG: hypothetical protein PHS73_03885 [Candidatus Peribacteraceae bacterium]|nr:hypothetical protein [Candidatus Peribacteraceae bacterium]